MVILLYLYSVKNPNYNEEKERKNIVIEPYCWKTAPEKDKASDNLSIAPEDFFPKEINSPNIIKEEYIKKEERFLPLKRSSKIFYVKIHKRKIKTMLFKRSLRWSGGMYDNSFYKVLQVKKHRIIFKKMKNGGRNRKIKVLLKWACSWELLENCRCWRLL